MRQEPVKGQLYRHFKGNVYEVVAVALHTEMDEFLVIYQNINDHGRVYARPVDMFLSEVDHDKYPDVKEKYRFTLVEGEKVNETTLCKPGSAERTIPERTIPERIISEKPELYQETSQTDYMEDDFSTEEASNENGEVINPLLEQLLDADSFEDKLDIFYKMRNTEDRTMLRNVAVSLDIETTKDDPEELYDEILGCLKMMTKYECNRLRRR